MPALLDVNVLVALAWPTHIHHAAAEAWFALHRGHGWATCAITETGFFRVSTQPAVVGLPVALEDARHLLAANVAAADHEFWALETGWGNVLAEIRERLTSARHLTDALLLDLAIRRDGVLVTFDHGVRCLLAPQSPRQERIEILSGIE